MGLETITSDVAVAAALTVTMGDGLDATPRRGERLFGNDDRRRERFQSRLAGNLGERLAASGIAQRDDADGGLQVIVFGHAIPGKSSGLDWVFYVDMSAHGPEPPDDPCWDGIELSRGFLGASSDEELEDVLIEAIVNQLDQWLHKRDYRAKP